MKTLQEIIDWLKEPSHVSTILIEILDVPTTGQSLYLSSKPFISSTGDTPSNEVYTPCIIGGLSFTENLSLANTISISYGDIEIDNMGGARDSWLTYVWVNKTINIFIGDPKWTKSDFRLIFQGIITDISSRNKNSLNLIITDKLQKLNNPITEEILPTINTTNEVLLPLTFGEVFNITPTVTDNIINTLEYQVHNGPIEDIIEVRDNGVPISFTKHLTTGKFTLNQNPYGQITCSVQGHKNTIYYNDIANLIYEIVTKYGPVNSRLTDYDIDLSNFGTFSASNTQAVGTFIKSGDNILTVCNNLATSIGAQLTVSSTGFLRLIRLTIPGSGTSYTITSNDIEENSLNISDKPDVIAATKLGYCKNWTSQQGSIAAGIPSQNINLFETEWLYTSVVNNTIQTDYKLTSEPKEELTLLIKKSDAEVEALRRNNLWDEPRFIYTVKAYAHMLPIELGDSITLIDDRFGLSSGKTGIAVSIARNWLAGRITIGILI